MRRFSAIVVFVFMFLLIGCSKNEESAGSLSKEGIAPYELTEDSQQVLEAFGMRVNDTVQLFEFLAPEEVITLNINVYQRTDTSTWDVIGNGAISIGQEREPISQLSGSIAMEIRENYQIDFHVNCTGQMSFSTEEIILDKESVASTKGYLDEFQSIELNTEIPIAVIVYDSGTSMRSFSPQDYYEPEVFEGMDLVQMVTVEFSDQEM